MEVAQRVGSRYRIAVEFLVAIMMPLLLLLLAGWVIVWRVVNQQLNPLTDLADALNQQTHISLEPVDETFVPGEIRPLTSAMNALLVACRPRSMRNASSSPMPRINCARR